MKNGSAFTETGLFGLPDEILKEIFSHLSLEEVNRLRLLYVNARERVSTAELDVIWKPYLKRLKALDKSLDLTAPAGKADSAWRYPLFKEAIVTINTNLSKIITFHQDKSPHLKDQLEALKTRLEEKKNKLGMLEEVQCSLDILLGFNLYKNCENPGYTPVPEFMCHSSSSFHDQVYSSVQLEPFLSVSGTPQKKQSPK